MFQQLVGRAWDTGMERPGGLRVGRLRVPCHTSHGSRGSVALASGDLARLDLRLLALYFVIGGLLRLLEAGLVRAALDGSTLPAQLMARGVAHVLIGGLVLSLAPGLARRLDR